MISNAKSRPRTIRVAHAWILRCCVGGLASVLTLASPALAQDQPKPTIKRPDRGKPGTEKPIQAPPIAPGEEPTTVPLPTAPGTQPAPSAPGQAAAPEREKPKVGTIVRQVGERNMVLTVNVRLHSDNNQQKQTFRDPFTGKSVQMPMITPFSFSTLGLVWPVVPSTASSVSDESQMGGTLRMDGREVDSEATMLQGYPGGLRLARFDIDGGGKTVTCRQVEMQFSQTVACFQTTFDERAAMQIPWAKTWPREAATAMTPQMYIEKGARPVIDPATGQTLSFEIAPYDDKDIVTALDTWLRDDGYNSPQDLRPAAFAKFITQKVWDTVQMSGNGLATARTGELAGVMVQAPSTTLREGRGSEPDIVAALAAVLRKGGLPTRTVIGFDVTEGGGRFLQRNQKENKLRFWLEFCLFDEAHNTYNWVPIDIARLIKSSSKPVSLDRTWKYFGAMDDTDLVVPFALQFHPPTDVVSYGTAGFWGWFVTPKPPAFAEQALRFQAGTAPNRGGDGKVKESDDRKGY